MRTLSCLPVVQAATDTDPMELGTAAQILFTQGLFNVHVLAMAQLALATTTPKAGDLVPIVNQGMGEVGSSRSIHAVQVDMKNVTIEVQNGGQRRNAAGANQSLITRV